jgi:hypothetical protein
MDAELGACRFGHVSGQRFNGAQAGHAGEHAEQSAAQQRVELPAPSLR